MKANSSSDPCSAQCDKWFDSIYRCVVILLTRKLCVRVCVYFFSHCCNDSSKLLVPYCCHSACFRRVSMKSDRKNFPFVWGERVYMQAWYVYVFIRTHRHLATVWRVLSSTCWNLQKLFQMLCWKPFELSCLKEGFFFLLPLPGCICVGVCVFAILFFYSSHFFETKKAQLLNELLQRNMDYIWQNENTKYEIWRHSTHTFVKYRIQAFSFKIFLCERKANEKTFLYSWMCVAAFFAQTLPHAISPYRLNEINLSHQTKAYREFLAATTTESTLAAKWSARKKPFFMLNLNFCLFSDYFILAFFIISLWFCCALFLVLLHRCGKIFVSQVNLIYSWCSVMFWGEKRGRW